MPTSIAFESASYCSEFQERREASGHISEWSCTRKEPFAWAFRREVVSALPDFYFIFIKVRTRRDSTSPALQSHSGARWIQHAMFAWTFILTSYYYVQVIDI